MNALTEFDPASIVVQRKAAVPGIYPEGYEDAYAEKFAKQPEPLRFDSEGRLPTVKAEIVEMMKNGRELSLEDVCFGRGMATWVECKRSGKKKFTLIEKDKNNTRTTLKEMEALGILVVDRAEGSKVWRLAESSKYEDTGDGHVVCPHCGGLRNDKWTEDEERDAKAL